MAHSFIQTHDHEEQALRNFVTAQNRRTSVLIDTYDTGRAAQRVATLVADLRRSGAAAGVQGVRIDSGDLAEQARRVRGLLDAQGCEDVEIILSGDLDEYRIAELVHQATPARVFGVGTRLDTSADAPSLDMAYKLEEYAGRPRRKRSAGKETWPGRKQVYRQYTSGGELREDCIGLATEEASGEPLLQEVMRDGRRLGPPPTLQDARELCRRCLGQLPAVMRELHADGNTFPVRVSAQLRALAAEFDRAADGQT
jgi:nicotinate phosphoribosyltransferase